MQDTMKIACEVFDLKKDCAIMGILNVTPDSFSDGGKWNNLEMAKKHAAEMIEEGARIIDVGGESTRPGHVPISNEEEIQRVVPVIEMIKECFEIPVSIDSYKVEVVEAALKAGADLVNDIWGLKSDPHMAPLIAKYNVPCVLMHNRNEPIEGNFIRDYRADMEHSLKIAYEAGISDDKIILDPGVGFGKTYEQNLVAIKRLDVLRDLGFPVLLATSRKSVIGNALDLPTSERVEGTIATSVLGVTQGASFVRVHDVLENYRAIKMTQAVMNSEG